MTAILGALVTVLLIDPEVSAAVLVVMLTLSLARSHLDRDLRGSLESAVLLPVVALSCVGIGTLLRNAPWAGAALFVLGMTAAIWVRRFGARATRAGSLIALPLVTVLVTPPATSNVFSGALVVLMPVIVALIALAWVTLLHWGSRRLAMLPAVPAAAQKRPSRSFSPSPSTLRPSPNSRLSVQMATSLIAAFVVGFIGFPDHWAWVVLTTYIVGSGNRGRGDVAYKSILRVAGAAAGTVVVVVITGHLGGQNPQTVALILTAVFLGIWLRPLGYAWWALFATLALSLLQGYSGSNATLLLAPRLEEIVIGAIIAVATAWFVLPVRSIMVLRRRLADALGSLQAGLEPDTSDRSANQFQADLTQLRQVLPAFNARRMVTRGRSGQEPADWIDTLTSCETSAVALIKAGSASDSVRHAVRSARRSLKEPSELQPALERLKTKLFEV
ncbi:FUSC family protein [Agreia sp. COWG]|uniref:FUSC family protein n=1 Tax=Agreia sp. COWG TaxID=2773266 RepID=UPI001F30E5C7|nr:FUSC family protein [Agreia sp. COWG]